MQSYPRKGLFLATSPGTESSYPRPPPNRMKWACRNYRQGSRGPGDTTLRIQMPRHFCGLACVVRIRGFFGLYSRRIISPSEVLRFLTRQQQSIVQNINRTGLNVFFVSSVMVQTYTSLVWRRFQRFRSFRIYTHLFLKQLIFPRSPIMAILDHR